MNIEIIREQFRKLRLPAAAAVLEEIITKKSRSQDLPWLCELLEYELDARKESAIQRRIKNASFPELTSLELFNWQFNPKIPKEKIMSLWSLDFVKRNEIALFLGNPGTGKTHCAIAIGARAAQAGYSVYCTSVKNLSRKIILAKQKNMMDQLFRRILNCRLWILDDWGVISMNRDVSEEVFDLLDKRKHSSAMILTSNRDIEEWPQVFSEPVLANAAIDRMFEHASISIFQGESFRMKGRIQVKSIDNEFNEE